MIVFVAGARGGGEVVRSRTSEGLLVFCDATLVGRCTDAQAAGALSFVQVTRSEATRARLWFERGTGSVGSPGIGNRSTRGGTEWDRDKKFARWSSWIFGGKDGKMRGSWFF